MYVCVCARMRARVVCVCAVVEVMAEERGVAEMEGAATVEAATVEAAREAMVREAMVREAVKVMEVTEAEAAVPAATRMAERETVATVKESAVVETRRGRRRRRWW